MFTVIFVEQEHMDLVKEYSLFLQPFMDQDQFAFCKWCPGEGDNPEDIVPELAEIVGVRNDWRALILCDKENSETRNPFNRVEYKEPIPADLGSMDDYAEKKQAIVEYSKHRMDAREHAFQQASKKPLVKLGALLCEDPEVIRAEIKGMEPEIGPDEFLDVIVPNSELESYLARKESRWAAIRKNEIRKELRGKKVLPWTMPREVICIALRNTRNLVETLDTAWNEHEEHNYSRFYDWNLYYDKMRYLIYDIRDEKESGYLRDYITFLTAVMLFAGQDTPYGALAPYRVYKMSCTIDQDKLGRYLRQYLDRLDETQIVVHSRMQQLLEESSERLTDHDAKRIFCSKVNIPVTISDELDYSELYLNLKPGLFTDVPRSELSKWIGKKQQNHENLRILFKQPARSINKAAGDLRRLKVLSEDRAAALNEFQLEDVAEHTLEEEKDSVKIQVRGLEELSVYEKEMDKVSDQVSKCLDQRITCKTAMIFIGLLCLTGLLCCTPLFIGNIANTRDMLHSLVIIAVLLFSILLSSFVALLYLRHQLEVVVRLFNTTMDNIRKQIEENLDRYGMYLSHVCNAMRGNSVLQYADKNSGMKSVKISIYEKHMSDIQERSALVNELFGSVVSQVSSGKKAEPYHYDFSRPVDYPYPMYSGDLGGMELDFLQPGNRVSVPVNFITNLSLRREELYD